MQPFSLFEQNQSCTNCYGNSQYNQCENESGQTIGYDEAEEVSDILKEKGFCEIRVVKDLSGLDRVVMARKGDLNV